MRIADNLKNWERQWEQEVLEVLVLMGAGEAPEEWDGLEPDIPAPRRDIHDRDEPGASPTGH